MSDDRLNSEIARKVNENNSSVMSSQINNVRFNIEGLEKEETQNRVKKQLEGMVGVQKVDMSTGQSYCDIEHDEHTTVSEINSHLQNNGYKVTDIM